MININYQVLNGAREDNKVKMKTVVITGSARGLGYEMAKCFRKKNFNVVICDVLKKDIDKAKKELEEIKSNGQIISLVCDITKENDIINLINETKKEFKTVDFWINNAGVNQPDKLIWEMDASEIDKMIDIDLKGTILASIHAKSKINDLDLNLNMDDEVVIGSPIWNARLASPINTILKKYEFVRPSFVLYSGSGTAKAAIKYLNKNYPNSKVIILKEPKKYAEELDKLKEI